MFSRTKKPSQPAAETTSEPTTRLSVEPIADSLAETASATDSITAKIEDRKRNMVSKENAAPTIIQNDMVVKGVILTDGAVELHGVLDGDVCAKNFTLGEDGTVKGDVVAEQAELAGRGEGRVTARRVRLGAGCRYKGDILHQRLSIEDGAEFEGQVLRKTDETAWTEITKTFDTPGVELTDDAMKAVDALKAEFERRARN